MSVWLGKIDRDYFHTWLGAANPRKIKISIQNFLVIVPHEFCSSEVIFDFPWQVVVVSIDVFVRLMFDLLPCKHAIMCQYRPGTGKYRHVYRVCTTDHPAVSMFPINMPVLATNSMFTGLCPSQYVMYRIFLLCITICTNLQCSCT